jgi:micrococcal nuclease
MQGMRRRIIQAAAAAVGVAMSVFGFVLAGAAQASSTGGFTSRAKVTRVIDGDTLVVRLTGGRSERVRLIGVNAPERGECYFAEASALTRRLAGNHLVVLRGDPRQATRDRYSRLLAYMDVDGASDVGALLLQLGGAHLYVYNGVPFKRVAAYRLAETAASAGRVGLWDHCGQSTATTPATTTTTTASTTLAPPTTTTTTAATTTTAGNCDPSYPTVCIPPPPPDLDCKDVPYRGFKVVPPDPHRFDGDHDGVGCES